MFGIENEVRREVVVGEDGGEGQKNADLGEDAREGESAMEARR